MMVNIKVDISFPRINYVFVDYPDSQYRVVASSQFSLQNNNFAQFDVKMLHFPGEHNKNQYFMKMKIFFRFWQSSSWQPENK